MVTEKNRHLSVAAELRRRAEKRLKDKTEAVFPRTDDETQQLIYELQVHQIELEMQNEELLYIQQELDDSRTLYIDLYDQAPVGYLTLSEQGLIQKANLSAAAMLGISRMDLCNAPIVQFIFSEDQDVYYLRRKQALKTKRVDAWEMRMVRTNGSLFWAHLLTTPAHNGEYWINLSDISERKEAEERQKVNLELLHLCNIAESTQELIRSLTIYFQNISDCEGIRIRLRDGNAFAYCETQNFPADFTMPKNNTCNWNRAGESVLDNNDKPVLDCICGDIISGLYDASKPFFTDHGSFWSGCTTELLASATAADLLAKSCNRCNDTGYESLALVPIRYHGETIGLFEFSDKRKGRFTIEKVKHLEELVDNAAFTLAKLRSDEALRRSEKILLEAQVIACLGSYVYNIPADRWTCTATMYSIFGLESNCDLSSADWSEIIHPSQRADLLAYLKNVKQEPPFDREYRIIRKCDGAERWVHSLGILEYDADGCPVRMTGSIQDITVRKQSEDDLRGYARRVLEMEEDLRKKLAEELHDEIARDLTVVGMNMTIVGNTMSDKDTKKIGERVQDSARLIKDISRSVRGMMASLRPPVLDDYGLLASLRWHVDIFSKRNGIEVDIQADDSFPRMKPVKEVALFRITQEALMNVVKHADSKFVTIRLSREKRLIRLAIIDDGNGYKPASFPHVQADFGWGMKIMRERAESIGAQLLVDFFPDKGTVVSVVLELQEL